MKKYKGFLFIASLALVVVLLAGCSSHNPIAEELATQRAALTIGDLENGSLTVNGTAVESGWSELFRVGSNVELVAEPDEGYEVSEWEGIEHNEEDDLSNITLVMPEENTRIRPVYTIDETDGTGDVGAEGLTMEMETQPGNTMARQNIVGPPAVIVTNNDGPVEGVEVEVSLDAEIMLDGTVVQTTDADGIATFDDIFINTVGSDYELVFDAEVAEIPLRVESNPFDVFDEEAGDPGEPGDNGEDDPGDDDGNGEIIDPGEGDNGEVDPGDDNGDNGEAGEPGNGENGDDSGDNGEVGDPGDDTGDNGETDPGDDNGEEEFIDATIDPTTGTVNLQAPTNVTTSITWNDADDIIDIKVNGEAISTNYYSRNGNTLVIKSDYFKLEDLGAEDEIEFEIVFDGGNSAILTVNIIDEEVEYGNGYTIDPAKVYEDEEFSQEFTIILNDTQFKAGAIVNAHITLGGDFAGLEIISIEKVDFPARTDKLNIKLAGELTKVNGFGYIGVSSSRMVNEKPFIALVDVLERDGYVVPGESVDYESMSFNTQRVISSNGNVDTGDSGVNAQAVEEGHVKLELLDGTIKGARDLNGILLNGQYELLILVNGYEGENDENGYEFIADFEDGTANDVNIGVWEFSVGASSISISLPGDLYLKFR